PNANAIRWGTMYNFRFDANTPPQTSSATIGFFKTGDPITVQVQGPGGAGPTPTPTLTPTPVPVPTPPGIEADLAPRPGGNGSMTASDSAQFKRFIAGLDMFSTETNEFQRADVAPKDTRGDGRLTAADQQQLDNYIAGLDPPTTGGGPSGPIQTRPADDAGVGTESVPSRTYRILPTGAEPGSDVVVTVELNGSEVETGMSFTILFDRETLEFRGIGGTDNEIDVMPGKGSPRGLMRTLNATNAHKGRLGLLLQSRTVFEAGRREILYLRFHVRDDARPGNTLLAFGDETLVRGTTNAAAAHLGAAWNNGTVEIGERRTAEMGWISTLGGGRIRGLAWPGRRWNSPF
ncbi:MAG TPA: hypothetical protein VNA17_10845, partial [Pyrinomonadaceae bacterium]|nr:hypothetical protein [Pyrinomonadaceae bacterium]